MEGIVIFGLVVAGFAFLIGSGRGRAAEPTYIVVQAQESQPAGSGCFPAIMFIVGIMLAFTFILSALQ